MEPVTHLLTGACLGRAGFNRTTAYATMTMVLAAEAPDLDMLWYFRGSVAGFEHHRGITHTFLGSPFMALFITGLVWLWHRWQTRKSAGPKLPVDSSAPPLRWGRIWLCAWIADLSHILLDWTNNYGVRPFFPFNPHWFDGSIFFLFEPILFAFLVLALVVPAILRLADREIGVHGRRFHGRGWAILALSAAVVLGCWRWAEHKHAVELLARQNYQNEAPLKVSANPYPGDPFQWFGVVETKDFYQTAFVNTRADTVSTESPASLYYKPPQTPAILAAKRSWLGRVFLDWSKFPFADETGLRVLPDGSQETRIRLEDLRFAYNVLFMHGRGHRPFGGSVVIGPDGSIVRMRMNGQPQKLRK